MKALNSSLSLKSSKYRWENVNTRTKPVNSIIHTDMPSIWNRKGMTFQHYQSNIPFISTVSKGWFSRESCDVSCTESPSFDLKLCCFIDAKYVPRNTISSSMLLMKPTTPLPKKLKVSNFEQGNSLVKISKHKLVRNQERTNQIVKKNDSSLVYRTCRKLIRRTETIPSKLNISQSVNRIPQVPERNTNENVDNCAPVKISTEKENFLRPSPTNVVVLTRRKLIRKPPVAGTKAVCEIQNRLISISRNKMINSSLLRNNTKSSKSVLYHIIKQRRRPYSRSSYVLLTRNKLIRRSKVKPKLWQKQSVDGSRITKKTPDGPKTFVSVGKNKLIRKSLFSKRNKITTSKIVEKSAIPFRKTILSRVLSSPSMRIQRFTNHLSRINLKYSYIRGRSAYSDDKNKRYLNRCKNNRRIFKKKSDKICPIFRRKGICVKDTKKHCHFVHDPKYIILCQKFLKGTCDSKDCPLSHDLILQKMPVCVHFLNNTCTIDGCLFLHSKPEVEAPICTQFLRGYCELADKCPNWHVYACPEYKQLSSCNKGENCRLPHRNISYFQENLADGQTDDDNWRYFEKNAVKENDHPSLSLIPGTETMGSLPDFIPL